MESQSSKKIAVSLVVLLMIVPLNIVHEMGHAFVCAVYGFDYSINLSWLGKSSTVCLGGRVNEMLFGFTGGFLVVVVLLVLLAVPFMRNNMGVKIGLNSLLVTVLVNSLVEGMFFGFYNQNIVLIQYGLLMVLLISFLSQWLRIIFPRG